MLWLLNGTEYQVYQVAGQFKRKIKDGWPLTAWTCHETSIH
jgi:hypothetical protein